MITQYLLDHQLLGIVIGVGTFLVIGLFHPLVIKGEYWLGQRVNIIFLLGGVVASAACVTVADALWQALLGVVACSCFWSILEVRQQRRRVRRGWYPEGPGHLREKKPLSGGKALRAE